MANPLFEAAKAAAAGAAAGQPNKPKLIQIGLEYASLKDLIRVYLTSSFNSQGEVLYSIVFRYFKGMAYEEVYSWVGVEGETQRDQEYADLHGRLEAAGFDFI